MYYVMYIVQSVKIKSDFTYRTSLGIIKLVKYEIFSGGVIPKNLVSVTHFASLR